MDHSACSVTGRQHALTTLRGAVFRSTPLRGALAGCGLLIAGASQSVVADEWVKPALRNATERLIYRFEVASYCGLVSARVGTGFRMRLTGLIAREQMNPQRLREARARAWKAARWEWENRGLGGFRAWCRTEGRSAAALLGETHPLAPPE